MALHNLKITVIDGGKASGGLFGEEVPTKDNNTSEGAKQTLLSKVLNYNATIKGKVKTVVSPTTYFVLQAGVGVAMQTSRQAINYFVSDIGRKNGDSNYQALINRKIEVGTDIASVAGGILGGAAAGSMFGLAGAVVGGVIGGLSAGVSIGFKQANREREYAHEMFKDSQTQAYNISRAGFNYLNGRVR